jgi:hypothetical protein
MHKILNYLNMFELTKPCKLSTQFVLNFLSYKKTNRNNYSPITLIFYKQDNDIKAEGNNIRYFNYSGVVKQNEILSKKISEMLKNDFSLSKYVFTKTESIETSENNKFKQRLKIYLFVFPEFTDFYCKTDKKIQLNWQLNCILKSHLDKIYKYSSCCLKTVKDVFNLDLGYDEQSIEKLDSVIEKTWTKNNNLDKTLVVKAFGCFLGEAFKRCHNAYWVNTSQGWGLYSKGVFFLPFNILKTKLNNCSKVSINKYYKLLLTAMSKGNNEK